MNALRRCFATLLLLCAIGGSSDLCSQGGSSAGADPLLGHWRWFNGVVVTVTPNSFTSNRGHLAQWKYLGNAGEDRRYEFNWGKGVVDTLSLSADGNRLSGRNKLGDRITADRIHAGPPQALKEAKGEGAKAEPASPAKGDPILGRWSFPKDQLVTFHADGVMINGNGNTGRWIYLKNPEVERKYRMQWDGSPTIETVSLSRDGKKFEGRNTKGERVAATRVPSLTD